MIKVAFIGAGRMASAMVRGLLKTGHFSPPEVGCTCGDDPTGPQLASSAGITYEPELKNLLQDSDVIVLACKPQQFNSLNAEIAALAKGQLIISILAGIPLARISSRFPEARNCVRAMPNTPGQIGAGISAYASGHTLDNHDEELVQVILGALGQVVATPEDQLDAVTAVSGSGPAYVFEFTAALAEAGVAAGLPPEIASRLARQTVTGAGLLLGQSVDTIEELRRQVTSPGGTTQAALEQFNEDRLRDVVRHAVLAAKQRSIELAQG
ncbi:pyrroline-5-carboxylate reductase [Cerasicoccus arenae]|uniref:Pyrroline-5-carboxylate reductase n=1 Tax=Cerasicoccus arenae TaxID=424488 RepID=A0A8J3DHC6_9BACT|nr:pyrroline-5-carboxylate reductase [Cerasicoccus arenae]MBK1859595.1 pyrroline-5-carboxylate reductase [Cerasicoccus arenae]GHB92921.1 pyrroline-5-carboxylate reductase [Cerasicoccus arenae]